MNGKTQADILPSLNQTMMGTGALTVAGQRRNFTVFPNILAITVVKCAGLDEAAKAVEQFSVASMFIAVAVGGSQS